MQQFISSGFRLAGAVVLGSCLFSTTTVYADVVTDFLSSRVGCTLAESELANMNIEPLFQVVDGQCEAIIPEADAGAWFGDNQCTVPITYSNTKLQSYCDAASNREELGNGLNILNDSWTLHPGNRVDFGARSLDGVSQPYMQRLVYRQVPTARGRCDLEMRVYKKHPTIAGQRSMLMLHGGSWSGRGFGNLGLELAAPHFVEQGFVVYSPFYRLLDDTDSSEACNQAQFDDIVTDANAALDWVFDNAEQYGSSGLPVVFGQSAGAHLALSLSVNRPSSVAGAVLMYPPTDFTDFLQRIQSGAYTNPKGFSILERVVGTSPDDVSLTLPLVIDNSFPTRIATEGGAWPPMFIVQGSADELLESRQSVRLCDALAGRELSAIDQEVGEASELRDVLDCGTATEPASTLHLIKRGEHGLDVCLNPNVPELCLSGGSGSQALVSQSIGEAVDFAVAAHQAKSGSAIDGQVGAEGDMSTGGETLTTASAGRVSTGGAVGWFGLLLLLFVAMRRRVL